VTDHFYYVQKWEFGTALFKKILPPGRSGPRNARPPHDPEAVDEAQEREAADRAGPRLDGVGGAFLAVRLESVLERPGERPERVGNTLAAYFKRAVRILM
jgi:hypothetical protein